MASQAPSKPSAGPRPDVGDQLMVIHDFEARTSDELSLKRGDRVKLIERDDEYGDGWFLGSHLANGNAGLFPEAYTRPLPKTTPSLTQTTAPAASGASKPLSSLSENQSEPISVSRLGSTAADQSTAFSSGLERAPHTTSSTTDAPIPGPLNASKAAPVSTPATGRSVSSLPTMTSLDNASQDSQVLNDTLNVIDEHITDLRTGPAGMELRPAATDSGSEYSGWAESASYIQGDETDEEEGEKHTRADVQAWTPDAVAEYLFTSGAEKHHCEVFRDQEISGEVLLGMDQSSLFIKDFDLGSVGRRLKTWHKIKALQDEVGPALSSSRRATQTYGSDAGSEGPGRTRSRNNTLTDSFRPTSVQAKRLSVSQTPKASPTALTNPDNGPESPSRPGHVKRPSAASVRDLHHSRRHSATAYAAANATPPLLNSTTFPGTGANHKKMPSFDKNWTLGGAASPNPPRPLSSSGFQDVVRASDPDLKDSAVDLDRGYFSGTEADAKKRNVLRKRDSTTRHSRQSSYAEEQRVRSATAISRHSRFGSIDSYSEGLGSTAAQKYYGVHSAAHKRTASTNTAESYRPVPPAKDTPPPVVTKLDGINRRSQVSSAGPRRDGFATDWLSSIVHKPQNFGLRSTSEGNALNNKAGTDVSSSDQPLTSPTRTGSTTPSGGPSFDLESPDTAKSPNSALMPLSKSSKRKGKKGTSAYTRGLLRVRPQEAMVDADYSGWMRKKSSNLMTTWKNRFFVLKGRRLSYFYSMDDDQERGLIDISFHRVLPADNEKLTGLHATITAAVPNIPGSQFLGSGSTGDNQADSSKIGDPMFIFKLVPPRAGLSRAVNFTKPTIHYFAVQNVQQGRLWMAALMKATIDRDDAQPITTTYQQKTISLAKAKQMRHRPPALMNLEETTEDEKQQASEDQAAQTLPASQQPSVPPLRSQADPASQPASQTNGLGIFSGVDSGVSGMNKLAAQEIESPSLGIDFGGGGDGKQGAGGVAPSQST